MVENSESSFFVLFLNLHYFLLLLRACVCAQMHDVRDRTGTTVHLWRSENSSVELILSFFDSVPGTELRLIGLHSKQPVTTPFAHTSLSLLKYD